MTDMTHEEWHSMSERLSAVEVATATNSASLATLERRLHIISGSLTNTRERLTKTAKVARVARRHVRDFERVFYEDEV